MWVTYFRLLHRDSLPEFRVRVPGRWRFYPAGMLLKLWEEKIVSFHPLSFLPPIGGGRNGKKAAIDSSQAVWEPW
jgi:hypothetical protein